MRRRTRAFTLVEVAITLSIMALLTPAIFVLLREAERTAYASLARARSAESMRTLSEELRRDLDTMSFTNETGFVLARSGCETRYELRTSTLVRKGCDGERALARNVASLSRTPWGVEVTFAHDVAPPKDPLRITFRMGLGQ